MLVHKKWALVIGLVLIFGTLVACQPAPELVKPSASGIGVGITSDQCPNVIVNAGDQVAWTNQDNKEHIVRENPAKGNSRFDSGTLQPGDSFTYTFIEPGEYSYICASDGTMTGTITIQP